MSTYSDYLENRVLDHITGRSSFTMPTAWVALFTANPTDAGGGTETTYGSYARVATSAGTWGAASGGSITNSGAAITFPACTSGTATITGFGAYDASSAGNLLWYGTCSLSVSSGITPTFATSSLTITQT